MNKFDDNTARAVMRKIGELRYRGDVPFEWQVEFIDAYAVMRQQFIEIQELLQSSLSKLESDN